MSIYAGKHASAWAKLKAKGVRIVFTLTTETRDETTGALGTPVVTTMSGYALGLEKGDPATYERLGLTISEAPSLMVVCDTFGDIPPNTAACEFRGLPFTVRDAAPFAPDGTAIYSTIVVAR